MPYTDLNNSKHFRQNKTEFLTMFRDNDTKVVESHVNYGVYVGPLTLSRTQLSFCKRRKTDLVLLKVKPSE